MKRMQRVFGDIDALGFVDGRLDDDRRAAFLSHLASDPAAAERVAIWGRQNEIIRAAFAGVALESIPVSLRLTTMGTPARAPTAAPKDHGTNAPLGPFPSRAQEARGSASRPAAVAYLQGSARAVRRPASAYRTPLSAAILVALAVFIVYIAHGVLPATMSTGEDVSQRSETGAAAFLSRASDAYLTYALDPVRPVEFSASQIQPLNAWVAKRIGMAVRPPDLAAEGWALLGGRLVPGASEPGVFFVYENMSGDRLGVFAARATAYAASAVALGPAGNRGASMTWVSGSLAYVITVGKSLDWLSRNGEALKEAVSRSAG